MTNKLGKLNTNYFDSLIYYILKIVSLTLGEIVLEIFVKYKMTRSIRKSLRYYDD